MKARTVDEAVARGLVRLGGLSRSEVNIEVLSEGKGGLLGFGAEEALVRLTTLLPGEEPAEVDLAERQEPEAEPAAEPPLEAESGPEPQKHESESPAPHERGVEAGGADVAASVEAEAPEAEGERPTKPERAEWPVDDAGLQSAIEDYTRQLLGLMGCTNVAIQRVDTLLPEEIEDEDSFVLGITGNGTERLLRREAEALLALQFLVRLAASRMSNTWMNLLLDVNGDRARRVKELFHLAEQSAELVEREGRPVSLPPMTPYERRVVHLALRNHETVATQSIGSGDSRKVTVRLKGQLLPNV